MEKTTKAMRCISLQFRDISRYCIVKICKALPRPWSWLSGLNCCQGTKCTVSAARAYIEQSTINGTHSAHHSTIFINFIASSCQHLVETCDSDPRMGKRWCVWRTPCHLVGLWLTVTKTMKWIWYALVLSCVVHHFIPPVWKGDCGCSSSRMFWHSENPFFVSRGGFCMLLHSVIHTYSAYERAWCCYQPATGTFHNPSKQLVGYQHSKRLQHASQGHQYPLPLRTLLRTVHIHQCMRISASGLQSNTSSSKLAEQQVLRHLDIRVRSEARCFVPPNWPRLRYLILLKISVGHLHWFLSSSVALHLAWTGNTGHQRCCH